MAFSERVTRLKSSLIRDILAAAQRPEVMSFAGGLPAERCLPAVDWSTMPAGLGQYGMSEGEPASCSSPPLAGSARPAVLRRRTSPPGAAPLPGCRGSGCS